MSKDRLTKAYECGILFESWGQDKEMRDSWRSLGIEIDSLYVAVPIDVIEELISEFRATADEQ